MALLDTLSLLSTNTAVFEAKTYLLTRFQELMAAVVRNVDPSTGAWFQILDRPDREGNYVESSGSSMFIYFLLKGVRMGYLHTSSSSHPPSYPYNRTGGKECVDVATKAYRFFAEMFVVNKGNGTLGWNGTVGVCSLNSSASFEVRSVYSFK